MILRKRNSKKKILFAGVSPTNFVQFKPVYKILKQDPRIEIFLSGMYQGKDNPDLLYSSFNIDQRFVVKEKKAKRFLYDMYISPDFHLVGKRHNTSVQLFHTTSFRNFSVNEQAKRFEHLFLLGPYMKRKFLESGIFKDKQEQCAEIGMPQVDTLVDKNVDFQRLPERLKLDRDSPTLLYAPVWAPIENFLQDVQKTLQILSSLHLNILIKMHPNFYYRQINTIQWPEYLDSLLAKNRRMHLIIDYDITPYMRISDLLVSDASAVVHQFSILDRPIVCIKIDIKRFQECWPNLDYQAYANRAVIETSPTAALKEVILSELANPGSLSRQRLAMAQDYFYNIGSAAQNAILRIYNFLNLDRIYAAQTPIVPKELVA